MLTYIAHNNLPLNSLLLSPKKSSHKGNFGHVMVMEGHESYLGASRLSAYAALRAGAGLVSILVNNIQNSTPYDLPEYIKIALKDLNTINIDSLVMGPGLSKHKKYQNIAQDIFDSTKDKIKNIILDADGLFLLKKKYRKTFSANIIATPHPKEAAFLLKTTTEKVQADGEAAIKNLLQLPINDKAKIIWVLKGSHTLVGEEKDVIYALKGEVPLLSMGGSGDILAGSIAGLIRQTQGPLEASLLGVSLNIASAKLWENYRQKGVFPREVADLFPMLLKRKII